MAAPASVVHSVEDASVVQEPCGRVTLFRLSGRRAPAARFRPPGRASAALGGWLKDSLKDAKHPVALHLRERAQIDGEFVQVVLKAARDGIRHKRPLALIDPPGPVVEALEQRGATDLVPILSCEAALREAGSIPHAVLTEQAAIADIGSRYEINPLWRKLDQESTWLCPFCGSEVPEVKI